MIDVFDLKFYWGARKESTYHFAKKIHKLLLSLEDSNPLGGNWCMLGTSRKKALESPFENTLDNIENELRTSKKKSEIDEAGFSELGFRIALYKEDKEENEYGLKLFGGYDGNLFPNNCILSFWEPSKFTKAEMLDLVRTVIHYLEPEYGCVVSNEFEELIRDTDNQLGWITLSEKYIDEKLLPNSIVCEKLTDNYIYYLKDENNFFDYSLIEDFNKLKDLLVG